MPAFSSALHLFTNPGALPLWAMILGLIVGTGLVWWCGSLLSRQTDTLADRTGLGRAFVGLLLLGGATSLPEIATTITAAGFGNADLAGNNLLGGLAMQMAVLAVVDAIALRRGALTFFSPDPALLMQGVVLTGLCAAGAALIVTGERYSVANVGLGSTGLMAAYVLALWRLQRFEGVPSWQPEMPAGKPEPGEPPVRELEPQRARHYVGVSTASLWRRFALTSLGVLVAGALVARSAEGLSIKTGISGSFVGATLVAVTTSLPEITTTFAAVRLQAYAMAVANILGTNAISIALLWLADIAYRDGAILNALGPRAAFMACLGALVTSVFLWGLLERRDRTLFGVGIDSLLVFFLYGAGLVIFSFL